MTRGWAVKVTTERHGGGEPMVMLYAAACSEPEHAVEAVRESRRLTPDELVETVAALSDETMNQLGIVPGHAWPL